MKGVDTNILVRYLTQDDAAQSARVDRLIDDAEDEGIRLHIEDIVLCELVWVLRGAYRFGKAAIVSALEKTLAASLFHFDDRDRLRRAVDEYREGGGDFADYVIGERNASAGCESTLTFDRNLRGSTHFLVL